MFGTAIPEDLVIQFHVEGSSVVCSVYGLQYHSQKKNGGLLGTAKSSKIWYPFLWYKWCKFSYFIDIYFLTF